MASKFKREFKNVVLNYSDAESKVREATSNDPWGPNSTVMTELAEYTFHIEAYGMVMGMLWKRLNDHGKNWRHVYKALVVLEYLIKSGSERVTLQCKENLFSIQTLKDFQYIDKDGKDQGTSIREKAKNLVALLKDEDRLKEERARATQARGRKEGIGSDGTATGTPKGTPKTAKKVSINVPDGHVSPDSLQPGQKYIQPVEQARPAGSNEEDMQLKLAIELSKQQAKDEERLTAQEEESLKAALELSKAECSTNGEEEETQPPAEEAPSGGDLLLDFSSSGLGDPWKSEPSEPPPPSYDMIAATTSTDSPWGSTATAPPAVQPDGLFDPWGATSGSSLSTAPQPSNPVIETTDPWNVNTPSASVGVATSTAPISSEPTASFNPFDLSTLDPTLPALATSPFPLADTTSAEQPKRVEDDFLGDLAQLVNLDSLTNPNQQQAPKSTFGPTPSNPFGNPNSLGGKANPFDVNKPQAPTLNQLAGSNQIGFTQQQLPTPLVPVAGGSPGASPKHQHTTPNGSYNPFS